MAKTLTLILGGARSGKSTHAERLAAAHGGNILYVATAQAWDDEMVQRIAAHRAQRPAHWRTLEAPIGIGEAIIEAQGRNSADLVLLDCLTLLTSNVILALPEPITTAGAEAAVAQEVYDLCAAYVAGSASWIIVSNEVGLGIVPEYPLGRHYRDALGRANQRLAACADRVLFMVAGLPMTVK